MKNWRLCVQYFWLTYLYLHVCSAGDDDVGGMEDDDVCATGDCNVCGMEDELVSTIRVYYISGICCNDVGGMEDDDVCATGDGNVCGKGDERVSTIKDCYISGICNNDVGGIGDDDVSSMRHGDLGRIDVGGVWDGDMGCIGDENVGGTGCCPLLCKFFDFASLTFTLSQSMFYPPRFEFPHSVKCHLQSVFLIASKFL